MRISVYNLYICVVLLISKEYDFLNEHASFVRYSLNFKHTWNLAEFVLAELF